MKFSLFDPARGEDVIGLVTEVFTASAGETEGRDIGNLVSDLITKTPSQDLIGCIASDVEDIVGCIFFSRFIVPNGQIAFIMSPVAIATSVQGTGIGQQLINFGLDYLKSHDVALVFTYGDPAFYSRTGFRQIKEDVVTAPFMLSQPIGWQVQPLDGSAVQAMRGSTKCVEALSDQKYW